MRPAHGPLRSLWRPLWRFKGRGRVIGAGRGQRGVVKRRPAGISRRARDRARGVTIGWWKGALECGGICVWRISDKHREAEVLCRSRRR